MKLITTTLAVLLLVGCASSSTQYYEAVQKAAEANAKAAQAKFDALAAIASAGDGQAASAAVMALALTQTPSINPVPQQSDALQWASVLASPVTSLGMMWMQADSAKAMARYNTTVDLARVKANAETEQSLYGSFVNTASITGNVATTGLTTMGTAVGNVDYTPFVDGMVTLGTAGMTNLVNLGTDGFDTNESIATAGFTQIGLTAEDGINATGNVGIAGIEAVQTVGVEGMIGIYTNTLNWLEYSNDKDLIIKDMLQSDGCTITTNADGNLVVTCN